MKTSDRKKDHVSLSISGNVDYQKTTGFEKYYFRHNALPELDIADIDTSAELLGRRFDFPLFISSMTGGYSEGGSVNGIIATFCEQHNLPFGVGSQRVALEEQETRKSFEIVRKKAPTAFIAANIGGCQIAGGLKKRTLNDLVEMIEANALIIHLNPLQELMQPEGDRDFRNILFGIREICQLSDLPVIIKETGAGISGPVAERLITAGVSVIDIAGAGGTSWSRVENERTSNKNTMQSMFNEWGIPTVKCLQEINELEQRDAIELIASGGIRDSFDIAKSICMGANFTAAAQPVIKSIMEEGLEGMNTLYNQLKKQLTTILVLLGKKKVSELSNTDLITK